MLIKCTLVKGKIKRFFFYKRKVVGLSPTPNIIEPDFWNDNSRGFKSMLLKF